MPPPRCAGSTARSPAVVTSIGPGAMQAFAGSLAAASNGVGVYHIYGDETTFGEGYNMQQVPKEEQGLFGQMTAIMGRSYVLHTPEALRDALRRGALTVNHPYRAGPFFCCCRSTRSRRGSPLNLAALPERPELARAGAGRRRSVRRGGEADRAAPARSRSRPAAARAGTTPRCAGSPRRPAPPWCCRPARPACCRMRMRRTCTSAARRARSAATTPWPKPSCVIVIGSRAVCQADCSGIGYKKAKHVININGDLADATHYNRTTGARRGYLGRRRPPRGEARGGQGHRQQGANGSPPAPPRRRNGRPTSARASKQRPSAMRSGSGRRWPSPPPSRSSPISPSRSAPPSSSMPATCRPTASRSSRTTRPATPSPKPAPPTWASRRARCSPRRIADKPRYGIAFTRRRLLHDEPADPDRRRRARRARHHRDLRQPPHGGDHRPADGAIRRRLPHQRWRGGRLRAPRRRRRRRQRGPRRLDGRRAASTRSRPRTRTTASPSSTSPSTPATTSSPASAPGASGTSATGARTCSGNGWSRTSNLPVIPKADACGGHSGSAASSDFPREIPDSLDRVSASGMTGVRAR